MPPSNTWHLLVHIHQYLDLKKRKYNNKSLNPSLWDQMVCGLTKIENGKRLAINVSLQAVRMRVSSCDLYCPLYFCYCTSTWGLFPSNDQWLSLVADLGENPGGQPHPLILGKKEEITVGRKASRASEMTTHPCLWSRPGSVTDLFCKGVICMYIFYLINNVVYYMASSASGQDDPNCALWLATRAGNMEPSCPLGTTGCIPQEKFPESHIINPL